MSNELVSIITPTYNSSDYILLTINSVITQTYKNWEMLIVDDCSTDDTVKKIKVFIEENNETRIRVFTKDKNSGAAVSRNRAIREAKGRWIAFLDSDDIWEPFKLEEQVSFMEKNGYHFSNTYYSQIDDYGNSLHKTVISPQKITKLKMVCFDWVGCLTVMYDADYVGSIQIPENIKKRNDYAMWLMVIEKCDCYCYPKVCAHYRVRQGSISRVSIPTLIKHHVILFKSIYECSSFLAWIYTINNIFWGTIKKVFFVKRITY